MIDINTIMIYTYVLAIITTAIMGIFVGTRMRSEKRGYFVVFIFCSVVYEMGLLFEIMASTTDGGFIATMVTYSGAMLICPTFLIFVQKYCERELSKIWNTAIFLSGIFVILLVWTSQLHTLYYTSMEFRTDGVVRTLAITRGVLYPLGDLHPSFCMAIAIYLLVARMKKEERIKRKRISILIFCALAPALSQLLTLFRISFYGIETTPLFLVAAIIVTYLGLLRYDLLSNEETIRVKKEFLQDMNHEMRNPLAVIGTGIDLIDSQLSRETRGRADTVDKAIETIRNETQRIGRMLDGMVALASMNETGANRQKVDLAELLRSSAEAHSIAIGKRGNELSLDIAPGLPNVFVERDRIVQVMANLLSNAARHTKGGKITVRARQDRQFITVSVSDTGEGIEPDIFSRVFERGVSADGRTGYGLCICKNIVEAHGGTINIEQNGDMTHDGSGLHSCDTMKKGTTVEFTIPIYGGQEVGRKW